jgi:hypothetical protein
VAIVGEEEAVPGVGVGDGVQVRSTIGQKSTSGFTRLSLLADFDCTEHSTQSHKTTLRTPMRKTPLRHPK